jgi:hypothetical protein
MPRSTHVTERSLTRALQRCCAMTEVRINRAYLLVAFSLSTCRFTSASSLASTSSAPLICRIGSSVANALLQLLFDLGAFYGSYP